MDVLIDAWFLRGNGTRAHLHADVPLHNIEVTRELGVGRLTGTIPPEFMKMKSSDGLPVIGEWATLLEVWIDGRYFDAYIVDQIIDKGDVVQLDCVGWLGYLKDHPYRGVFKRRNIALTTVFNEIVRYMNSGEGTNVRYAVWYGPDISYLRVGNVEESELPPLPPHPGEGTKREFPVLPAFSAEAYKARLGAADITDRSGRQEEKKRIGAVVDQRDKEEKKRAEEQARIEREREAEEKKRQEIEEYNRVRDERERMREQAAFRMEWWSTIDLLGVMTQLCEQFSIVMRCKDQRPGDVIPEPLIEFSKNHFGFNKRHVFVEGENVMKLPDIRRGGARYATSVRVVGAGEGAASVNSTWEFPDTKRDGLRKVHTIIDKSLRTSQAASRTAKWHIDRMRKARSVGELTVVLGLHLWSLAEFDVGEVITYRTLDRRSGSDETEMIISEITVKPDEDVFYVTLEDREAPGQ